MEVDEIERVVAPPTRPRRHDIGRTAPKRGAIEQPVHGRAPDDPSLPTDNTSKPNSGLQDFNFKIAPIDHRRFQVARSYVGMSGKDLILAAFQCWIDTYADDTLKKILQDLKV